MNPELTLSWQDILLTLANMALMAAMVPEFMNKPKMPLATSVPAAVALLAFSIAYFSVGLWSAGFASIVAAGLWGVLIADHPRFNKKVKREAKRRKRKG